MSRSRALALAFLVCAAACQKATTPPSSTPEPRVPVPPPAPATPATTAPPAATAAPAPPAESARVPAALFPSNAKRFGCGDGSCAAGAETCCVGRAADAVCVPTVPLGPGPIGGFELGALAPQMAACQAATGAPSFVPLASCDESADCAGGICCAQAVSGDTTAQACVAKSKTGKPVCDLGESCAPGGACATAGATCLDGACVLAKPRLTCGATVCKAPGAVCCGDPPRCATEAACREGSLGPVIACRSARDCLPGYRCLVSATESFCSASVIGGVTSEPCASDAACRSAGHIMCPKTVRCTASGIGDLKTCQCP